MSAVCKTSENQLELIIHIKKYIYADANVVMQIIYLSNQIKIISLTSKLKSYLAISVFCTFINYL